MVSQSTLIRGCYVNGHSRFNQIIDTELTTWSLTPRANVEWLLSGQDHQSTIGADLYYAFYNSDRGRNRDEPPIHTYRARQTTFGLYGQDNFGLFDSLTGQVGGRFIWNKFAGGDEFDPNAPGAFGSKRETTGAVEQHYVYNIGLEYEMRRNLTAFGRTGRSIRLPTINERIASSDGISFKLKTQISRDVEAGLQYQTEKLALQGSAFLMKLKNELRFDPSLDAFGLNENAAPTQRVGSEMTAAYKITNNLKLQVNVAYIDAKFRKGVFADNQVPLVPQWQVGSQLNWRLIKDELIATLSASYIDRARLENDESNEGEQVPDYYLFDFDFSSYLVTEDEFYQGQPFTFSYFYNEELAIGRKLEISLMGVDKPFYDYMALLIEQSEPPFGPFETPSVTVRGNFITVPDGTSVENANPIENPDAYALGYFAIVQEYKRSIFITE